MPSLPPIASTVRVAIHYNNTPGPGNSTAANILHIQYPTTLGFTATELVAVANGAMAWMSTHFASLLASAWQISGAAATAVDGSGVQGVSTHAPYGFGAASNVCPPNCAVAVSWTGAPSYRGGKPRTYLPGVPTTAQVNAGAQLTSTFCSNIKAAAVAALADMNWTTIGGSIAALGAVSYVKKALNPTPPHYRTTPLFWPFLSAVVHERLDSQRRRSGKESTFPVV